jgi:hypothetical protein
MKSALIILPLGGLCLAGAAALDTSSWPSSPLQQPRSRHRAPRPARPGSPVETSAQLR